MEIKIGSVVCYSLKGGGYFAKTDILLCIDSSIVVAIWKAKSIKPELYNQ